MLASIIILTYNQEKFVRDAVLSAIKQDYSECEIIISDDGSTDETVAEIKKTIVEFDDKKKRIVTNFSGSNLGLAENVNKAVSLSSGDVLVLCAGDDISLPYRVSRSIDLLKNDQSAALVSFAVKRINSFGEKIDDAVHEGVEVKKYFLDDFLRGTGQQPHGASRALRRVVFDSFPPFDSKCPTEDTTGLFRSLLIGHALVSEEIAIYYRIHQNNLSSSASIDRMDVVGISNQYRNDLGVAKERGLVSAEHAGEISKSIDINHWRRTFKQLANRKELNLIAFFKFLLGRQFSRAEKIHYTLLLLKGCRLH